MKDIDMKRIKTPRRELFLAMGRDFYAEALKECQDDGDEKTAAQIVRKRRNELLEKTDARMSLDRLGLTAPSYTLTGITEFVRIIMNALTGDWAKYRQALRDLPEQPGFPFEVTWPEEPKE